MYISRVELDQARRSTMIALAAPKRLHGAVERSFAGERKRRLWRLDYLGGKLYLLILSEDRPDLTALARQFGGNMPEIREYDSLLQRIVPNSEWHFRLTANPTKSTLVKGEVPKRGVVKAHITMEHQKRWLIERAEKHGFRLTEDSFTITSSKWMNFSKKAEGRETVSLLSVTFEGILQVMDAELFCRLLTHGLGRGKAYGLGMMTVIGMGQQHG